MSYFRSANPEEEAAFDFEDKFSALNQSIENLESELEHKQTSYAKLLRDFSLQISNSKRGDRNNPPIGGSLQTAINTLSYQSNEISNILSQVCKYLFFIIYYYLYLFRLMMKLKICTHLYLRKAHQGLQLNLVYKDILKYCLFFIYMFV